MFIETSVFLPVSEDGRLINLPTVGPATFGFENRLPVLSSSTLVQFSATTNTALIVNLQNASTGTNASSEYTVTGSLGTTSTHHFKMGVRGSGYSDSNFSITGPNDAYLYTHGANLAIGTASGSSIVFHTAGTQASDERMRITETGWVGIGTPAPSSTLHVIGDAIFSGSVTATRLSVSGIVSSTGAVFHGGLSDSSAGDDALCIDPSTGEIRRAAGATDCTLSSRRFKHDIESLTVGLDALMDLRPVSFKMDGSDQERLGLVAEEVAEIEPRLVFFEEDGVTPRGVRYSEIASLLIKSIQEQQAMIRALQEGRADGLTFHSTATFLGGIVVKEHLYAGQDIAGHARLISGATRVRVTFDKTFLHQPIVTVTPLDFVDSMYRVTDVTIEGFTIQVNAAQSNDKVFAWHAIGSDGGKVFSSDGTTEDIEPVEPDPDEMPGGEPAPAISEPEPEPAPESESISESEPESVSEPEPEAVAEPEPVSEPLVEPEPVSEPELESDTAPEPEPSPEPEQAPATPPPDTGESS